MMDKKINLLWWISLTVLGVCLALVGSLQLDPDFGWHIRIGEIVSRDGHLPAVDPFSYTMGNFPFVDHEWLTNILFFQLNKIFGIYGLAIVFSLLVILAVLIAVPRLLWGWAIVPLLLSFEVLLARGGVRPQVESWFFLAVFLHFWSNKNLWKLWRWIVPVGFLLWANLHGSFAMGIVIFTCVVFLHSLQFRRIIFKDWITLVFSFLATFLNPYGWRLWYEIWMQISDTHLKSTIVEWQPFYTRFELSFLFIGVLVFAFWLRPGRQNLWWQTGLIVLTGIAGLTSLRHAPMFVVVALPFLAEEFKKFYFDILQIKDAVFRAKRFFWTLIGISTVFAFGTTVLFLYGYFKIYREHLEFYPRQAVEFLKNQSYQGELFSIYDWGGYLVRFYPEKRVFIDGRMPSWRWGLHSPFALLGWENIPPMNGETPQTDLGYAMIDYQNVLSGEFGNTFSRFSITTVLWRKPEPPNENDVRFRKLFEQIFKINLETSKELTFLDFLKENHWIVVYEDSVAQVWRKE